MPAVKYAVGKIFQDDCYYLDENTGLCQRKYFLVLAVSPKGDDVITTVLTSKPNGLTDHPACVLGFPRSGFYVGIPGGVLQKDSWVDFSNIRMDDTYTLNTFVRSQRISDINQQLPAESLCPLLRCVLQYDDLIGRHRRLIGDMIEKLNCP